jgi:hypothetical protein
VDDPEVKIRDVFICKLRKEIRRRIGRQGLLDAVWGAAT